MARSFFFVYAGLFLVTALCAGCGDGRPREKEAASQFAKLYPKAELVSVRNTEDEVVATSFEFTYRLERGQQKTITIQFMKGPTGAWVPRPAAPDSLP